MDTTATKTRNPWTSHAGSSPHRERVAACWNPRPRRWERGIAALTTVIVLSYANPASADVIILKDGAVLSGTVRGFSGGAFEIDGDVPRVPLEDVREIRSGITLTPAEIASLTQAQQEIQEVTTTVTIPWGKREATVVSFLPVGLVEVGLVPYDYAYYTGPQQYFGGRLVFFVEHKLAEATLRIRLLDDKRHLIDTVKLTLFDVQPRIPIPFVIDMRGRTPERVHSMLLVLETTRTRGGMRASAGRGKHIPHINFDPRAMATVQPEKP